MSMVLNNVDEFAKAWRPGSTVFSACIADGTEILLWLVPRVDIESFCDEFEMNPKPHHEVNFKSMFPNRPVKEQTSVKVPLVPTWWVFESCCSPNGCLCGPRSLYQVLPMLPRRLAGQAVAAHVDMVSAIEDRVSLLENSLSVDASIPELRIAALVLSTDLSRQISRIRV